MEELILNHPYFVEKHVNPGNFSYTLKYKDLKCEILIYHDFDLEEEFPVDYAMSHFVSSEKLPWFRELLLELNEKHFQKNRLRFLTQNARRPIGNILYFYSFFDDAKIGFSEKFGNGTDFLDQPLKTARKYESYLQELIPLLEKERYKVKILKKDEQYIYVEIN